MLVTFISALFLMVQFNTTVVLAAIEKDVALGKGLKHYQQGQYVEAQNAFQSLLKLYPDNPTLLFNLGLAHYQRGHYGLAMGLWHKVLDQNPYFVKATQAIHFTQEQISIQRSHGQVSWQERLRKWVLVYISWDICLFLTAAFGFFFLWSKIKYLAICHFALKRRDDRPVIPTRLIVLGLFFVFTIILAFMKMQDHITLRATIISPKVSVYVSPNQETASLFELLEGSDVIIKQMNDDWVQVSDLEEQIGWIQQKHIFHYAGEKLW